MKVLQFFGEPLSYGGQESFIINMYECFSIDVDYIFCTPFCCDNSKLRELISERNDKLISYGYEFETKLRKNYIYKVAKNIIDCGFDVIHIHSGSVLTLLLVACIAKRKGINQVIVHSHATGYLSVSHQLIKKVSDLFMERYADIFLACSIEAGKFKFSNKIIQSEKFHIIKNGIELEKYAYNKSFRLAKRKELSIDNQTLICHVGRFSPEKNHSFVLDVFNEYLKIDANSYLLLIGGNGPTEKHIRNKIIKLGLSDKVIILKNRSDVNEFLSAADIFIFPSLFEGLGISAIEAQAASLPTICAEQLPDELNVSSYYNALPLSDNPREWAQKTFSLKNTTRLNSLCDLKNHGYDVKDSAKILENIYKKVKRDDVIKVI